MNKPIPIRGRGQSPAPTVGADLRVGPGPDKSGNYIIDALFGFIIDKDDVIRYIEIVPEVTYHPDYDKALEMVRKLSD